MWWPAQAMRAAADMEMLPRVRELDDLYRYGFLPRRGQLLMVAGPPGSQKSGFALWYARKTNVRCLYFSADMAPHTAVTRHAAEMSGFPVESVAEAIDAGASDFFGEYLGASNLTFCFDSSPTLDDIADEIAAYVELFDDYPEMIIVDNAMNIEAEMGEEIAGLKMVLKELHRVARVTGAAVLVLHHTREEGDLTKPQPRSAIAGKINQLPERILTVAFDGTCFMFSPVKNRDGKGDATGSTFFRLRARPERASFEKWVAPIQYWGPAA